MFFSICLANKISNEILHNIKDKLKTAVAGEELQG